MAQIRNYSYKPELNFFLLENENLKNSFTFGFELEVIKTDGRVNQFVETLLSDFLAEKFGDDFTEKELFCFKRDGSIGFDGFEIVSQPMTFDWFNNNQSKFYEMFQFLITNNCISHEQNKCGLHFHMGNNRFEKNNFSTEESIRRSQLEQVATNMNMIINYYQNELKIISRRTETSLRWCKFSDDVGDFKESKKYIKSSLKRGHCGLRYHALNTTNENTLEFRLFRGTLNFKTFYISFNLVNNLAKISCIENKAVSFDDLFYSGLDNTYKKYAQEYFNEQRNQPRNRELKIKKSVVFTRANPFINKKVIDRKLEEMGLI